MAEERFVLRALPPFRLDLTAWALRRRPRNQVDRFDAGVYRRVLDVDGRVLVIEVQQEGPERLSVRVDGATVDTADGEVVSRLLRRSLSLDLDLSDFYQIAGRDPRLAGLVQRFKGLKPPRFPSIFEALANGISCQQISLDAGLTLLSRLAERYGARAEGSEDSAHAFPEPQTIARLGPEALRSCGYSFSKARSLIGIAQMLETGQLELDEDSSSDELKARLLALKGVGRWTAEYVLLRGFGRLDYFPGDDVGARRSLERWLGLSESLDYARIGEIVEEWQPYAGLVYFHLLLDSLTSKNIIGSSPESVHGPS